jgi:hypothetical protein
MHSVGIFVATRIFNPIIRERRLASATKINLLTDDTFLSASVLSRGCLERFE